MSIPSADLRSYLEYWLTAVVAPSTRPTTQRTYEEVCRAFLVPELGHIPVASLTAACVAEATDRWRIRGATNRRVRTAVQVLRTALRAATHRGLIATDPTASLPLPRYSPRKPSWLTPADARRLLAAVRGHRYEPAIVLAVCAGLRRGEVGALRWNDVDLRAGRVSVRATIQPTHGSLTVEPVKTSASERTIPIARGVVAVLRAAKARAARERRKRGLDLLGTDHVLTPGHGGPQWLNVLNEYLSRTLRASHLPHVTFQDLRHTAACLLLEAGAEPRTVMEILGHRRVAHTLLLYAHVRDDQKRRAVDRAMHLLESRGRRGKRT
jgi:integrase